MIFSDKIRIKDKP